MPEKLSYSEGAALPESAPSWAVSASKRIQEKLETIGKISTAQPPEGVSRVLLHSCCAPCSGAMVEEMCASDIDEVVVFFYNPNIHPKKEYEIRKEENKEYCKRIGVKFIDSDYEVDNWYSRMKGMEYDPERGHRCNEKQVDASGFKAAARYPGLKYWQYEWQSDEMTLRKYQISATERFYKQEYCGCSYSLRDSNEWRRANGIPKIQIGGDTAGLGDRYFSNPLVDAAEESQDVVDEFFQQAEDLAKAGRDVKERKKMLKVYENRRKNEKTDGSITGLNNW
ncbi:hypothetical protein CTEN210_04539 [Chaetoceros tenuissimus]|uniref:Epoxyqueuosine reductase QueH n=1 Tax=Chaetoceros tenuissimus TaxID=426638 RepID=A0AAD3H2V7_9STRA|nr:hypothetical protein CTEN210_04539 [Chaetoceros tenuissimus]